MTKEERLFLAEYGTKHEAYCKPYMHESDCTCGRYEALTEVIKIIKEEKCARE